MQSHHFTDSFSLTFVATRSDLSGSLSVRDRERNCTDQRTKVVSDSVLEKYCKYVRLFGIHCELW